MEVSLKTESISRGHQFTEIIPACQVVVVVVVSPVSCRYRLRGRSAARGSLRSVWNIYSTALMT